MTRIADLEAQVARLEAEAAPLRAALEALEWLPETEGDWAECPCCGQRKMDGHLKDGCQLGAALSSGAGKGWVSPDRLAEVRAHAPDGAPTGGFYDGWIAALDALKGVE